MTLSITYELQFFRDDIEWQEWPWREFPKTLTAAIDWKTRVQQQRSDLQFRIVRQERTVVG